MVFVIFNLCKFVPDFGLSRHFDTGEEMHQAVGTPYYIAPEVLQGHCKLFSYLFDSFKYQYHHVMLLSLRCFLCVFACLFSLSQMMHAAMYGR